MMQQRTVIAETGDGPPSKKVSIDVRIWDLLSKREEQFVLVDMAESFINTWLTRTLLGLTPRTPAEKQDYSASRDKIHREKREAGEVRAK